MDFGCHGIPERCLFFNGKPMPFCARCLGASIGHIGAFLLFLTGNLPTLSISLIFIATMGFDWSLQKMFGIMSNNNRRLVTGVLGGMGVGAVIWSTLSYGFHLIKEMV
jgi:uncharacterized membrane protein